MGLITGPKMAVSIFLVALSAVGGVASMVFVYLGERDSKVEAEVRAEQNAEAAKSVADSLKNYAIDTEEKLFHYQKEKERLESEFNDAKGVADKLSKMLAEHDIDKIARSKPGMLERRANSGTQQLWDDFEKATGAGDRDSK